MSEIAVPSKSRGQKLRGGVVLRTRRRSRTPGSGQMIRVKQAPIKIRGPKIFNPLDAFRLTKVIPLTIPASYCQARCLEKFIRNSRIPSDAHYGWGRDEDWLSATHPLIPGERFNVELFISTQSVQGEMFHDLIASRGGKEVGVQGLSRLYVRRKSLPKDVWIMSYDPKGTRDVTISGRYMPFFRFNSTRGDFTFSRGAQDVTWEAGICVACFCPVSVSPVEHHMKKKGVLSD